MKLAIYQGPSPAGGVPDALERIGVMAGAAAAAGAELIVFPELFLPGYNQADLMPGLAQERGGSWEQTVFGIARDASCAIAFGWAERENGSLFNAATVVGPEGTVLARYRKLQPFGAIEKRVFAVGETYASFELNDVRIGLLICYDVEFAHHVEAVAALDVDLIVVPTANGITFENVPRLMVPSRALESGVVIAYANYCGSEGDLSYSGLSLIAGPDGEVLASSGSQESLVITDIPFERLRQCKSLSTQRNDKRVLNSPYPVQEANSASSRSRTK